MLIAFGALAGIGSLGIAVSRDLPSLARVAVPTMTVTLGIGTIWLGWARMRAALATGAHIRFESDLLIIEHPGLFREPQAIARSSLRVVAVEPGGKTGRFRERKRFVVAQRDERHRQGEAYLFSSRAGSPIPIVCQVPTDIPNLALVFSHPVELARVRRGIPALFSKHPELAPATGQQIRGMLVKVADTAEAARVFESWGLLRPLSLSDLAELAPLPEEDRRRGRLRVVAQVLVIAVVGTQALIGWLISL